MTRLIPRSQPESGPAIRIRLSPIHAGRSDEVRYPEASNARSRKAGLGPKVCVRDTAVAARISQPMALQLELIYGCAIVLSDEHYSAIIHLDDLALVRFAY